MSKRERKAWLLALGNAVAVSIVAPLLFPNIEDWLMTVLIVGVFFAAWRGVMAKEEEKD